MHSDFEEDARVLLSGVACTISMESLYKSVLN